MFFKVPAKFGGGAVCDFGPVLLCPRPRLPLSWTRGFGSTEWSRWSVQGPDSAISDPGIGEAHRFGLVGSKGGKSEHKQLIGASVVVWWSGGGDAGANEACNKCLTKNPHSQPPCLCYTSGPSTRMSRPPTCSPPIRCSTAR